MTLKMWPHAVHRVAEATGEAGSGEKRSSSVNAAATLVRRPARHEGRQRLQPCTCGKHVTASATSAKVLSARSRRD